MAYHDNQTFNDNMLYACPILEDPEALLEIGKKIGAIITDCQSQEPVDRLCNKTVSRAWPGKVLQMNAGTVPVQRAETTG